MRSDEKVADARGSMIALRTGLAGIAIEVGILQANIRREN